ncbi:glycerol-3-phosphate cytidylyltransferase [compost metagenome]
MVINGDKMTSEYKRLPVFSEDDRKEIIDSIRYVDNCVISNDFDVKPVIDKYSVNIIIHGDDWPHEKYLEQIRCTEEYIKQKNIEMIYTPYFPGTSTSKIIKQLRQNP